MICPHCGKFIDDARKETKKVFHRFTFTFGRVSPSGLAILVADKTEEFWLPISQLEYDGDFHELNQNDVFEVGVSDWMVKEKGLFQAPENDDIPF
jgi:hypothetical protein